MSVNKAPVAASDRRYGPWSRTSCAFLFSSTTTTTWSGRAGCEGVTDATGRPAAAGGGATGADLPAHPLERIPRISTTIAARARLLLHDRTTRLLPPDQALYGRALPRDFQELPAMIQLLS